MAFDTAREPKIIKVAAVEANTVAGAHLVGLDGPPTVAGGTGAGTSPTITLVGSDLGGVINVTTGTAAAASNAVLVTVTFANAFAVAPRAIILTPNSNATKILAVAVQAYIVNNSADVTTTTFVVRAGGTALADATAYSWTYAVIG